MPIALIKGKVIRKFNLAGCLFASDVKIFEELDHTCNRVSYYDKLDKKYKQFLKQKQERLRKHLKSNTLEKDRDEK